MPLPGEFCWDQLTAPDLDAAAAFYQRVVGWTMDSPSPEMGIFKSGDLMEASLMVAPAGMDSHWLTYVYTPDLAGATQTAASLGATIVLANMEGGEWGYFSLIQDPTGAFVALYRGPED
jgi:predicted enzyme related to lactoylglutathione lyase